MTSEAAHGGDRCLRCGYEFHDGLASGAQPVSFCSICAPPGTDRQAVDIDLGLRESRITIDNRTVETENEAEEWEEGLLTADKPAFTTHVTPKWNEEFVLEVGETIRLGPARVRFKVKLGPAEGKWFARITVTLNDWSSTRSQFEDRLVWADAVRDEYLELLTVAGSSEIVWTSGWGSLRQHREGGERLKSYEIPDFSLPLLKKRQVAYFTDDY